MTSWYTTDFLKNTIFSWWIDFSQKQHAVKICKQIKISKIRSCESGMKVNSVFTEELQVLIKWTSCKE